ncbi:MAG: MopE-related protein, partial [Myxococcales bacterium]|nr:MopE-related protein [Myxococcales bacterium]
MRITAALALFVVAIIWSGCSGGSEAAGPSDASADGAGPTCLSDADCSDGLFCSGTETCDPSSAAADARGCVAGSPPACDDGIPCTLDSCAEALGACRNEPPDADGDGHADAACLNSEGISIGDDCDDADGARYPGNTEICNDRDEDCNPGTLGFIDADGDGAASALCCNPQEDLSLLCGQDCDDGDAATRPGAPDGPPGTCDTLDNDCDGTIDEGCPCTDGQSRPCGSADALSGLGECRPGTQVCVGGGWAECAGSTEPGAEVCNGLDDDCDGISDEGVLLTYFPDLDGDGFGNATAAPTTGCVLPLGVSRLGTDCDDADPEIHPGAAERCDGIDNDCDPTTNGDCECSPSGITEGCGPLTGAMEPLLVGVCAQGRKRCIDGLWSVCVGATYPGDEVCNGLDDDCNGSIDDGAAMICSSGSTRRGVGPYGFCPSAPGVYVCDGDCLGETFLPTPETEICNGIDDDCNGRADDPFECEQGAIDIPCITACGTWGTYSCLDTCTRDRCVAPETCNGCDDDGDGLVDEEPGLLATCFADADEDGFAVAGATSTGFCRVPGRMAEGGCPVYWTDVAPGTIMDPGTTTDCAADDPLRHPAATELCDGIDNDCIGGIDDGASDACSYPSAHAGCADASCSIWACANGFGECDGLSANGCEADLRNTTTSCGSCGFACGTAGTCLTGRCDAAEGVSTRSSHTCVLRGFGGVACWGDNAFGQLGDGTTAGRTSPVQVVGLSDATAVAVGKLHTCALRTTGEVLCWGRNDVGQLGTGSSGSPALSPVSVAGLSDIVALAAGDYHTCAVAASGLIRCWGLNGWGQLGNGDSVSSASPVPVSLLSDATGITGGGNFSCALQASGSVQCWGQNGNGQLGDGGTLNSLVPVVVSGLADAVQVSAGGTHACARRLGGEIVCWGSGSQGELGDGGVIDRSIPAPVTLPGSIAIDISAGRQHSCAVLDTGSIHCWGQNNVGQLGDGTQLPSLLPVLTLGITDGVEVAAGSEHSCARRASGLTQCWGTGLRGRLGDGNATLSTTPVTVAGGMEAGRRIVEIGVGDQHACIRRSSGEILCWGRNTSGQLGDGTTVPRYTPGPIPLPGGGVLDDAIQLAVGPSISCALRATTDVLCWGGTIGTTPTLVASGADAISVGSQWCAILSTGAAICGPGGVAVDLVGGAPLSDAVKIAAGGGHTCAVRAGGEVVCWGSGTLGQLGDGLTTTRSEAGPAVGLGFVRDLDLGGSHSCVVDLGGSVACWGYNVYSQVGD